MEDKLIIIIIIIIIINNYEEEGEGEEVKLLSVNASLITGLPESPNRPIGLFGVLAIVTKVGLPD